MIGNCPTVFLTLTRLQETAVSHTAEIKTKQ